MKRNFLTLQSLVFHSYTVGYLDLEDLSRMCFFSGSYIMIKAKHVDIYQLEQAPRKMVHLVIHQTAVKHCQVAWLVHISILGYHLTCTWIVWSTNLEEPNFPFVTVMTFFFRFWSKSISVHINQTAQGLLQNLTYHYVSEKCIFWPVSLSWKIHNEDLFAHAEDFSVNHLFFMFKL